jgi:hypothetical protein
MGLQEGRLQVICSGIERPIRSLDFEKFNTYAPVLIGDIAVSYCGADIELSRHAIIESAALLREKFSGIGIDEVNEAFKLAASKQIEANLAAYSGQFTVRIFGEVMATYIDYRRPVVAEIEKRKSEMEAERMEQEKQERNNRTRKEIIEGFTGMCAGTVPNFAAPSGIPDFWARILTEEKLVFGDAETWKEAKRMVVERFKTARNIAMPDETLSEYDAKQVMYQLQSDPEFFPEALRPRAEILYGQLIVWNEIQKNLTF